MEFSFALTLIFLVIADSNSQEMTSWGSVQISTCDVPLFDTPFSICCYTENLPNDTTIYFSNNFGHVARIKPSCSTFWYHGVERNSNITLNCNKIGNMTMYNLTIHDKFLQDYADVTFECGYYVRKRELKITVLDSHTTSVFSPGSSPVLYYKLQNGSASNIRLYLLQSNVTLLEVDQENNVTYHDNDVTFNGNVHQNNFSANILNLQGQRNGTYVCEYTIDDGTTMRDGITVVVLRKPKAPEIRNTTWEVFENGISVTLTCEGTSDFAAPPFYKPSVAANLTTEWIIPSENDWPGRNVGYFSSINGSSANISIFDCNETNLLPIYCKVSEKSLVSDKSFGFFPNITCSKLWSADEHDEYFSWSIVFFVLYILCNILATLTFLNKKRIMQAWRRQKTHSLIDGLPSERDFLSGEVQQALEEIAMEESRQKYELHGGQSTGTNTVSPVVQNENEAGTSQLPSSPDNIIRGAEGGAPRVEKANDDITILEEVESLLTSHQRQLGGAVIPLRVSRENILEKLIGYYTEEDLAKSRITVKFIGEEGMDYGGVTNDMFTTFWYRAQEEFFIGYEAVVPYLPPQRLTDDSKYQVLGRILSHSIAVMKEFPIHMCKSTIIAMIYETTDVPAENLFEDFLYFLDSHDRNLVTMAIHNYGSLTSNQTDELMTIFARYEYEIRITAENFRYHVTQLARHVLCIRPKPLLDKMRSGIPQSHMERFWSDVHLKTLSVLFRALKPTPERVIARLKTSTPWQNERKRRVFGFLKDLLKEMTTPEMETFLQFVTGTKSVPRRKIFIVFNEDTRNLRLRNVHTCSHMMELPLSYGDYETFRSEFKHLLASGEALKMSMA